MSEAHKIEVIAARWLLAREDPDWSADNQAMLDTWLNESLAHKAAYWRLEHGWRQADRLAALGAGQRVSGNVPMSARRWLHPVVIAASMAVVFVGVYVAPKYSAPPQAPEFTQVATAIGEHKVVELPDSSKVELNTATKLHAALRHDRRELWLDAGEAFFEVKHLPDRPFVVHAGKETVTVLGTKFSVRREGDKVTVSVLEGRVRIDDADVLTSERSTIIAAGDVVVTNGLTTLLRPRSEDVVERSLAWRGGTLAFDQTTLSNAADEFNRYNAKQIIIVDSTTAKMRISGTFQASNVDAFARLLRDAYGLNVTSSGSTLRISS